MVVDAALVVEVSDEGDDEFVVLIVEDVLAEANLVPLALVPLMLVLLVTC